MSVLGCRTGNMPGDVERQLDEHYGHGQWALVVTRPGEGDDEAEAEVHVSEDENLDLVCTRAVWLLLYAAINASKPIFEIAHAFFIQPPGDGEETS